MTNAEAFENVELEIASKRRNADLAREYVAERPTLSRATKEGKLHEAKWLDGEADALQLVLDLARKAVAPKAELPVGRVETITLVRKAEPVWGPCKCGETHNDAGNPDECAKLAKLPRCWHGRKGWCESCASS